MMKPTARILLFVYLCAFLVSACTPQAPAETPAPPTPSPDLPTLVPATPTPTAAPTQGPITPQLSAVDAATEELLNGMSPVFDSVARALMEQPEENRYLDGQNSMTFWSVLSYFCANYGESASPLVKASEDHRLIVPGDVMRQFAKACFAETEQMPELPPQTFDITHDRETDIYYVGASDAGDSYVKKIRYGMTADGATEALIGFFAYGENTEETLLGVFRFDMQLADPTEAEPEPLFAYRVYFAHESYTDMAQVTNISEKDGVYYATLNFVRAVTHFANDLDENGQPYGSDFTEIVDEKTEAVDVRISPTLRFTFHNMDDILGVPYPADLGNSENTLRFFTENATKPVDGTNMYFILNIYEGVLHGGELSDFHYAG